jgi:hypothetical protein
LARPHLWPRDFVAGRTETKEDDAPRRSRGHHTRAAVLAGVLAVGAGPAAMQALAQQAPPARPTSADFGLRTLPGTQSSDRRAADQRPADLGAGANAPAPDATTNYGKPRLRAKLPRRNPALYPPPAAARPALPPLEPYRTSAEGRERLKLRPSSAPVVDEPRIVPPPGVAVVPTLPVKPRPKVDNDPFAPVGIGIGDLRLRPYVETGIGYDDNPNRTPNPRHGSAFWRGDAGLNVQSDWSRHSVNGSLRLGYSDFFSVPSANRPDGAGAVGARIDVTRDTSIDLGGTFALDTLRPGSPDITTPGSSVSTNRPPVWTIAGFGGVTQRFNRLAVSVRGIVDRSQYGDATFSDGSTQYLSENDYTTVGVRPRIGYEITPGFQPFVEATVDRRTYDHVVDVNGFYRSSRGLAVRGGAAYEIPQLVRGEVSGGFFQRDYDDPRLSTLRGPAIDASLIWTPTPLTTVTLRGTTTLNETTVANSSGTITRRISGEIAHALLRNVTITAMGAYQVNDYQGYDPASTPGPITERLVQAGIKAEYNLTRTVVIKASYNFERLKSTVAGSDYTSNVFLLGLRLQR